MENDMKMIAEGQKCKSEVVKECVSEMLKIFNEVNNKRNIMKKFLTDKAKEIPQGTAHPAVQVEEQKNNNRQR